MSAFARLKRAVRGAIHNCGGIDGGAVTVGKCRSHVGSWNNLNQQDLPTLGDALALDQIAVIEGKRPEILHTFAAELGHVAICLPDLGGCEESVMGAMIDASAEFGDIAQHLRDATRDGSPLNRREREGVAQQIDEAQASLARMRLLLLADGGEPDGIRPVALRGGRS